jgi:hypothetical protein
MLSVNHLLSNVLSAEDFICLALDILPSTAACSGAIALIQLSTVAPLSYYTVFILTTIKLLRLSYFQLYATDFILQFTRNFIQQLSYIP